MPPSSTDPAQVIAAQRTELARLRAALEEALQRAAAAEAEENDTVNEARRLAARMRAAMAEMAVEMQQLRLDLAASRAAEAARQAEEQAVLAARTADVAAAAVTAAADSAVVQRLVDDAAGEVVDARVAVLRRDVRVACDSVASLAGPVYAAVFSLATSQRHDAHVSDTSSSTAHGSAAGDTTTGVADSAQAAMATADSAMRQLDATRAAVRRALSAARTAVPSDAAAASGDEVAAAARARDTAEQAAATALGSAADACARLASWRRSAETEAHRARAAAAAAGAMADALEAHLRMDGNGDASEVPDTMATLRDVALHVLPASQAAAVAVAAAVAALNTEAEALDRVSPKLVASLRSMATSAHANGDNALSADMSAGAGAAAAAEALAAEHTSALRSLRRVAAARAAAVAAVNGLPAAEETRLKALQSLLDLSHERSTAQLKREWTADREARYSALVAKHTAAVEAAEAAAENAAAALTSPAVVEAYPELAARLRDVAANAALVGLQPHSDATSAPSSVVSFATAAGDGDESFVSAAASTTAASESVTSHRDDWEQVDVLQRTPRCAVLRVRPRSRPGAPHRVLKVFPHADSSFLAEARHLAAARHPLVCELEAAYVEGGMAHLVLPFYGGGSTRPWFERLKTAKGGFDAEQWTAVRRTFRQLLQALAFCHGRGIAHRDVKPENVLWTSEDQSQLVLCDFGLSRDLSRRLETTRHVGAAGGMGGGTPLYLAPEALAAITDGAADDSSHDGSSSSASNKAGGAAQVRNWKDCPWAVDCFSVGICMLELACGEFITWHPPTRRLQPVAPPHGRSLPLPPGDRGGHSMGSFLALALALTQEQPDDRPSADEALLHPFFAELGDGGPPSQQPDAAVQLPAAAATGSLSPAPPPSTLRSPTNGAKLAFVAALLGETRVATRATSRGSPGSSCFTVALSPASSSDAALLNDVINAVGTASPAALSAPVWAAAIGAARVPVSDLLRRTFTAAASPSVGLLHAATPGGPHMPAPGADVPACRALGRLLWRGVVEGVPCGVELAPLVYAALLGRQAVALCDATSALAHWAVFDPAAASRARHAVALSSQGAAQDACAAAVAALWAPREEAFTALAAGFRDASDVAHSGGVASLRAAMELLDEWELGALFCGGAYVSGRDVAAALTWHGASWPEDDPHRAWLAACLAAMPEPSLRLFLARTTGRLALDPPSSGEGHVSIWVTRLPPSTDAASAVPQFPGNGVLALPHTCPDAATFQTRLFTALGVQQQQSTAAEETTAISTPPPLKCASCDAPVASTEATADLPPSAVLCPSCDPSNPAAAASACCVCLAAKRSTLLLPCRHLCMCNACATHVVERASARCPLCRVFIQARVMDIYL
jgi:serine/threonine protein kinase